MATSASSVGPRVGGSTEGRRRRPWLCLVPAALLLPFLDKAFNIDDPFFLEYARVLLSRPLHPFELSFFFSGGPTAVLLQPQPLGWSFLLAGARALFGESEPWLHLLNVGFALLGLHGLREIADRLGVSAPAACWLFASSSVFLCLGSTIMPYLAWSALSLAALARLIRGVDEGRTADLIAAGMLAAAAFLCCFAGAIVIGLLAVYPLLAGRLSAKATIAPVIGVAVIVACDLWALGTIGLPHFLLTLFRWSLDLGLREGLAKGSTEIALLGAQLPALGLPLVAIVLGRRRVCGSLWRRSSARSRSASGFPSAAPRPRPALGVARSGGTRRWPAPARGRRLDARARNVDVGRREAGPAGPMARRGDHRHRALRQPLREVHAPALPAAILLTLDAVQGLEGRPRGSVVGPWLCPCP